MADVTPDYKVSQQRLVAQISAQRTQVENQKLAIMELADRKRRHEENIEAAKRAISEYQAQTAQLLASPGPDAKIGQQRLRAQIKAQEAQVENQTLSIMEMYDRRLKHDEAIEAAVKAIDEFSAQLESLASAHGMLTDEDYDERRLSLDLKE